MNEESSRGFICINCRKWVPINEYIGVNNRNHCPHCLWSKHVDYKIPGDRMCSCDSGMKPIALTLKKAGIDKWGNTRVGEIMVVHRCVKCEKISINRIAGDDNHEEIMKVFEEKENLDEKTKRTIGREGIEIMREEDREELENQLFGKSKKAR